MVAPVTDGSGVMTRVFSAGAARFAVRCPTDQLCETVESLLVDLADASGSPERTIDLVPGDAGTIGVSVEDGDEFAPLPPDSALSMLVSAVTRVALDAESDELHLHAAAVSRERSGILISAPSGGGKTTLAAALVRSGWAYTSDESVSITSDANTCRGFPKPLTMKPGESPPLPEIKEHRVRIDEEDRNWWHVPASAIAAAISPSINPSLIVILQRPPDGTFDDPPLATPTHPTDAVVALMGQTMDAERFGPDAVSLLARLTAHSRCVTLQAGPIDATVELIETLAADELPNHTIRVLQPPPSPVHGWRIPISARSVLIDDRVVAHDTHSGRIVSFDTAGSALWLAVHGEPPVWWSTEAIHSAPSRQFLDELATHGLLSSESSNGSDTER